MRRTQCDPDKGGNMFTRRHILSWAIVLVLLLPASSATAPSGAAAEPTSPPQASDTDPLPLDPAESDWYAAVQEDIRQSEYQVTPQAGTGWRKQTGRPDLQPLRRAQGRRLPGACRARLRSLPKAPSQRLHPRVNGSVGRRRERCPAATRYPWPACQRSMPGR